MQNEFIHSSISMMAMFQNADLFMKLLILGLLFASIWCWAIIFDKMITLKRINEGIKNRLWCFSNWDWILYWSWRGITKESSNQLYGFICNHHVENADVHCVMFGEIMVLLFEILILLSPILMMWIYMFQKSTLDDNCIVLDGLSAFILFLGVDTLAYEFILFKIV